MERVAPGKWRVNGTMRLEDFRREFPALAQLDDVETMGGLLTLTVIAAEDRDAKVDAALERAFAAVADWEKLLSEWIPDSPVSPKPKLIIAATIIVALGLAVAAAVVWDRLFGRVNDPRELVEATGIPVGYVRAVAPNYTFFAVETFVDELARLAGVDPVEYRLSMLRSAPRLARVLKLAAEKAAWGTPLPPNVGRGVACVSAQEKKSPTWTASVVEAQVDPATGRVRIRKVTCAVDCGIVVNPDGARAQIEGSVLFGVSNALKEYGTVANGALVQSNFHDYQVLRMDEVPDVEVHVVDSREYPTGLGEPGTTTIAPALSNAIFAATGARVRSVPLLPARVLKALQEKA